MTVVLKYLEYLALFTNIVDVTSVVIMPVRNYYLTKIIKCPHDRSGNLKFQFLSVSVVCAVNSKEVS